MAGKPRRPGTCHGNKVCYDPISVSRCRIEKGSYTRNPRLARRFAKTLKLDWVPLSMKPERIQTRAAAAITGLKLRQVQWLALRGEIPGAAKLGSLWTFDVAKLRQWISDKEEEACRIVETRRRADFDVRGAWSERARLEEAYERALGPDPKAKGTRRR